MEQKISSIPCEDIDSLRKELHDGVGAVLSQITMLAYYGRLQEDATAVQQTFTQIAELSQNSLDVLRRRIHDVQEETKTFPPATVAPDSAATISMLIVEDNSVLSESLAAILQEETAITTVETCANAEEALEFLQSINPSIILVDLGLPGMSGVDLIKIVTSTYPDIISMVYTVFDDSPTVFAAIKAGASGYVLKDTPPHELIKSLITLKNGGAPMTPRIANMVLQEFQQSINHTESLLSAREEEIIRCIEQGLSYNDVAERLGISHHTVHTHIKKIYKKLQAAGRSDVLKKAREIGII